MQVVCSLSNGSEGTSNWLRKSRIFGSVIKALLDAQVRNNLLYLSLHRGVPQLYASGVRYQNEPEGQTFNGHPAEEFALIPVVLARKWGDCDDLAPWRVAELIHGGERAKIRVQWRARRLANGQLGRKYFHIVVRRGNGLIEDPSAELGMNS
jgi:hypothetical protein